MLFYNNMKDTPILLFQEESWTNSRMGKWMVLTMSI